MEYAGGCKEEPTALTHNQSRGLELDNARFPCPPLASLSAADLKLLEPHFRLLDFQQQKVLFEAGDTVSAVRGSSFRVTLRAEPTRG